MSTIESYPLAWPVGWPRTRNRWSAAFRTRAGRELLDIGQALHGRLLPELRRLGASDVVVSTNVPVRGDGLPLAKAAMPADPGVAVYFRHKGQPRVLACDKWNRLPDNIAAIAAHVEALRAIGRYGVGTVEQALGGYKQLTAAEAKRTWWEILGIPSHVASASVIEDRRRALALKHHPDHGGSAAMMAEINAAADEALASLEARA